MIEQSSQEELDEPSVANSKVSVDNSSSKESGT